MNTHQTGPGPADAKLAPPRARSGIVDRPRINRALDAGAEASLTLVAAPPGYGKTTAVRAWSASRQAALAWVTLDAEDNDPARLWTSIATALDRVRRGLAGSTLHRLSTASGRLHAAIDVLAGRLASSELVLVLDDLHAVTDGDCLASIGYAIERLPPNVRLIAITRIDPALRLPRLRAGGALAELRARELAFTADEASELLVQRGGIRLDAGDVEVLRARTDGWPAALVLAGIWLRSSGDPRRAVREFGGDHRFVVDYLSQEALGSLDDGARDFLLRASALGGFSVALCDAALARSDSAGMLAGLECSTLLIDRSELGGWYRVHPLLAEFGRLRLASEEPAAEREIHERAAGWLRSQGHAVQAAEHAAAAHDAELVAEILAEHHVALIESGHARALLRCLETLADERLVARPQLAVGAAAAATFLGRAFDRRRMLQLAARSETERPERFTPEVAAVAASVRAAAVDGDAGLAVREGRRAVAIAETDAPDVLVAALSGLSRALYMAGDLDAARTAALRALDQPATGRRASGQVLARATLALVAAERGRTESARTHAERAKALVAAAGASRSWLGANASAALGGVLTSEGRLAEAEHELVHAERFFREEVASMHHAWALILLGRLRSRRGRLGEAQATLATARAELAELGDGGRMRSLAGDADRDLEEAKRRARQDGLVEAPSRAELAVLRLLATDRSVRQIGEELFLSVNTVRSHTRSIYRKLGVNTREDAVARAGARGLLGPVEPPSRAPRNAGRIPVAATRAPRPASP